MNSYTPTTRGAAAVGLLALLVAASCGQSDQNSSGLEWRYNQSAQTCCDAKREREATTCPEETRDQQAPSEVRDDCRGNRGCTELSSSGCGCHCTLCYHERCIDSYCTVCADTGTDDDTY